MNFRNTCFIAFVALASSAAPAFSQTVFKSPSRTVPCPGAQAQNDCAGDNMLRDGKRLPQQKVDPKAFPDSAFDKRSFPDSTFNEKKFPDSTFNEKQPRP
ncbi:MAG: hypothetical protein ACQETX_01530 [Pseudomonadota bacterium]